MDFKGSAFNGVEGQSPRLAFAAPHDSFFLNLLDACSRTQIFASNDSI
jgi:hypothetical protein